VLVTEGAKTPAGNVVHLKPRKAIPRRLKDLTPKVPEATRSGNNPTLKYKPYFFIVLICGQARLSFEF
jgi:hypothetical protein